MRADVAYVVNDTVVPAKLSFHENAEFIKPYYNRLATQQRDAVSELNTMLAQDGILIHIPAGKKLERPLQIVNVCAATIDFMSNRRVLIVAEEGGSRSYLNVHNASDKLSYSTFEVGGALSQKGLQGFFYGDRGVWRPGDSIFMTLMV